jgi:hypothetical protein
MRVPERLKKKILGSGMTIDLKPERHREKAEPGATLRTSPLSLSLNLDLSKRRASDKRNKQWTQPTPRLEIGASGQKMFPPHFPDPHKSILMPDPKLRYKKTDSGEKSLQGLAIRSRNSPQGLGRACI